MTDDNTEMLVKALRKEAQAHGERGWISGDFCDLIEQAALALQSTAGDDVSHGFHLFMDGNMWCAVGPHFRDLMQDHAGFGKTPDEAYNAWWEANKNLAFWRPHARPDFSQFVLHTPPLDGRIAEIEARRLADVSAIDSYPLALRHENPTLPGESGMRDILDHPDFSRVVLDWWERCYHRAAASSWDAGELRKELRALSQSSKPPPPAVPSDEEMLVLLEECHFNLVDSGFGEGSSILSRIDAAMHELARRMVKP